MKILTSHWIYIITSQRIKASCKQITKNQIQNNTKVIRRHHLKAICLNAASLLYRSTLRTLYWFMGVSLIFEYGFWLPTILIATSFVRVISVLVRPNIQQMLLHWQMIGYTWQTMLYKSMLQTTVTLKTETSLALTILENTFLSITVKQIHFSICKSSKKWRTIFNYHLSQ